MSNNKSTLPNPPKSIGLSRRLVIAAAAVILSVMVLFLVFLKRYSPKQIVRHLSYSSVPVDQEDSSAQIAKIEKEVHRSVLVDVGSKSPTAATVTTSSSNSETGLDNDNEFREASNASISVYHAPTANTINASSYRMNSGSSNLMNPMRGIKPPAINNYKAQNMQSEKIAFLKDANKTSDDYIKSKLHKPLSPFEIKAGTIIPATLMTGINSTLPGTIIAKVRRDVFDTVSGNYLLIPQGTTLLGHYDSQVAYGQSRVLIVWSRLIFPNGSSFDLQGMPGADLTGMAGLHDKVDNHYFKIFGSALLFSLFGAAGQLSQPSNSTDQLTTQQILYAAIGQQMSQSAMQLMEKNMNIQPTILIRPGTNFNVLLTRDMELRWQCTLFSVNSIEADLKQSLI